MKVLFGLAVVLWLGTAAPAAGADFDLDIDEDKTSEALTDGLLIIRHMFGFSGEALTAGAVSAAGTRTSAAQITQLLDANEASLDVDGNGTIDPLTDGLLIIRSLFGFSGQALVNGAIATNAARRSADLITNFLQPLTITQPSQFTVATQKLLLENFNQPQSDPAQWAIFSLDVTTAMQDRYAETMAAIKKSFGGYMNWNYMVLNESGTDSDNEPVMQRLTELKYNGWEDGYTTQELKDVSSCLGGAAPNGYERDADYEPHSTCMVWKGFLEQSHALFDPNYQPEQWQIDLEATAQSLQHEYFHHYQRAHALDRGLDDAPWWWIEGAAMAGEMWWLRGVWDKLSYLKDSAEVGTYILDRLESDKKSFWFNLQRIQKRPPILEPNGHLNSDIDDCYDWKLSQVHSDGYPDSYNQGGCEFTMAPFAPIRFMAYKSSWQAVLRDIPADYFEHGFWGALKIHTGLNEQEFYDEFNAFMRSTNWEDIEQTYAPQGWNTPDESIETHVDFLSIKPFGS